MTDDIFSLRRRAGWAVFQPVLSESVLQDALWEIHDSLRGQGVNDVIRFVDRLIRKHGLDPKISKSLYAKLFDALKQSIESLPEDPWPSMVAGRPDRACAPAPVAARSVSALIPQVRAKH
jgi:hypothetical protein